MKDSCLWVGLQHGGRGHPLEAQALHPLFPRTHDLHLPLERTEVVSPGQVTSAHIHGSGTQIAQSREDVGTPRIAEKDGVR
jgi:hypothetical protein